MEVELNNQKLSFDGPMSIIDIVNSVNPDLLKSNVAAKVNGTLTDLRDVVDSNCSVELVGIDSPEALSVLRHTTAHVMAEAVKHLFPEAKLTIGPATENGFFYDFDFRPFTNEDLENIEKEMKKIVKKTARIERKFVSREEAAKVMTEAGEPYKLELLADIPEGELISLYSQNDFTDLCCGPHLLNTYHVKNFKLLSASSAYWRGDASKASLARIHGTAFFTKEQLEAYLEFLENRKNKDHNKIGRELELFTTVDVIGQGLPLLMPNGVKIVQTLQRWIEDEEDNNRGYVRTKTPLMAKSDLYKISGHWGHYRDKMFIIGDPDSETDEVFALRPMTCPFQYYVYKNSAHSYRDLPIRYGETSTLFRKEESGEMHGLTRVRQFTISEGHLVVTPEQMVEEFKGCIDLARYCLQTLGLEEDVTYHLSKWDPNDTEKYIGTPEVWEQTQQSIRDVLNELGIKFTEDVGEAAFYGPKVDINARNVYGKEDTMITIQWDAMIAELFDMYYIDKDGKKQRPYIIHRTSIGCYERTLAWLTEKYEGKFPTWLCPEQVRILPISEKFQGYCEEALKELQKRGIRASVDERAEKIGYKIRDARNKRIPYMLIIGQNEVEQNVVSVRSRFAGDEGSKTLKEFISQIREEIDTKAIRKEEVTE